MTSLSQLCLIPLRKPSRWWRVWTIFQMRTAASTPMFSRSLFWRRGQCDASRAHRFTRTNAITMFFSGHFACSSSENDLEEVLTFYTQKNKSASVFLGTKCDSSRVSDENRESEWHFLMFYMAHASLSAAHEIWHGTRHKSVSITDGGLKGIVHPQIKSLLSFTLLHVIPNP